MVSDESMLYVPEEQFNVLSRVYAKKGWASHCMFRNKETISLFIKSCHLCDLLLVLKIYVYEL